MTRSWWRSAVKTLVKEMDVWMRRGCVQGAALGRCDRRFYTANIHVFKKRIKLKETRVNKHFLLIIKCFHWTLSTSSQFPRELLTVRLSSTLKSCEAFKGQKAAAVCVIVVICTSCSLTFLWNSLEALCSLLSSLPLCFLFYVFSTFMKKQNILQTSNSVLVVYTWLLLKTFPCHSNTINGKCNYGINLDYFLI